MTTKKAAAVAADKYPTKKATSLSLGDTIMRPATITRITLNPGAVDVTFTDGATVTYKSTQPIPVVDQTLLPPEA